MTEVCHANSSFATFLKSYLKYMLKYNNGVHLNLLFWKNSLKLGVKRGYCADDVFLLLGTDLGIKWQTNDFPAGPFRLGKIAFSMPQIAKTRLEMKGHRIINRYPYSL